MTMQNYLRIVRYMCLLEILIINFGMWNVRNEHDLKIEMESILIKHVQFEYF